MGEPSAAGAAAIPRRRLLFGVVGIGLCMVSIDQTIVATALTAMERDLHAPLNWASWTITAYAVGQILVVSLVGKISDRFGAKQTFVVSVAVFTAASLCCGVSVNIYELVALRFVQAIGGGGIMPSGSGIVSQHFGRDRDRALGLFSSIFPIGAVIGPILGGIFVTDWSWRGIFLVNVPIGAALVALGMRFIPENPRRQPASPDVRGIALLALCLLPAMFGISFLGSGSVRVDNPVVVVSLGVGIGAGWLFVGHVRRHPAPIISAEFLLGRSFGLVNLINFMYGAAALGFTALVPLYAEERYSMHPLEAGTLLTARGAGMIALSGMSAWALRRTGYRSPMMLGFVLMVGSLLLLAMAPPALSPYRWLALAAGLMGLGLGVANPASNNASLQLAPNDVPANAGLRNMFRQAGAIMAVSVTTAMLARSGDPGIVQAHIFLFFAALLVATMPLITRIPDNRGAW